MKIAVLQSSYEGSNSVFKDYDPYCDPSPHLKDHQVDLYYIKKATAIQQLEETKEKGYDVYINLCDGGATEDRAGVEVVQWLEDSNLAYTGGDPPFYEPTKESMKRAAVRCGVKTPAFVFAYSEDQIQEACNLNFPLIVKHYNGSGSIGTSKKSKVTNREELYEQARYMIREFGGALIEEFVAGREFTVLVAENFDNPSEPLSFQPVECSFLNGEEFKYFDIKFINYNSMKWIPCMDPELSRRMQDVTKKVFVECGGVSYGRADLRVDQTGTPYFLEINPNCGIFSAPGDEGCAADYILTFDKSHGHRGFLLHIIDVAIRRAARKRQAGAGAAPAHGHSTTAVPTPV
jgi:D-alanine-D-alanine ligase